MSEQASAGSGPALAFGPFRLYPAQRLLLEGDKPVRLGSRALEILTALVERPGSLVSKDELVARVWPDTVVEEANLRVHIAAIRKVLGEGHRGARYLKNDPGRGYSFVAPVHIESAPTGGVPAMSIGRLQRGLPARLTRMVGRDDILVALAARLREKRFVTIVGPGGIGKTTVAIALAEQLMGSFDDGVAFVDLSLLADATLLQSALASSLGLSSLSEDLLPSVLMFLEQRHMLIVFDNGEHLIDALTILVEKLLKGAPKVCILTTSREPLRAESEWVHRLASLDAPRNSHRLTAAQAIQFPSIQLFMDRVASTIDSVELTDDDASLVGAICRRLDGIPLAIELVAARADLFGIRGLATQLDDRFLLLTQGRRTALPRHKTLGAMLDWSYELLTDVERTILQRLSVFTGGFTLEAAISVVADDGLPPADVHAGLLGLASKSLVSVDVSETEVDYRLLDVTRAYAAEKLDADEETPLRRRHARYCLRALQAANAESLPTKRAAAPAVFGRFVNDVRAAIEWAFGAGKDPLIALELTTAAFPMFYRLSMLEEGRARTERALSASEVRSNPLLEIELLSAFGHFTQMTRGPGPASVDAFARALDLAEQFGSAAVQANALLGAFAWAFGLGDYPTAQRFSERLALIARSSDDPAAMLIARRTASQASHFLGRHAQARSVAEAVLALEPERLFRRYIGPWQLDPRVSLNIVLARVQWLTGYPEQASRTADLALDLAAVDSGVALCQALALAACPIAIWSGDREKTDALVARLLENSKSYTASYWHAWGRTYDLAVAWIDAESAARLEPAPSMPAAGAKVSDMAATLAPSLCSPATILRVESGLVGWCAPEVLRARGELALRGAAPGGRTAASEYFQSALALAREQGALSWQLRAAISLVRLEPGEQRGSGAFDLLRQTYEQFTEGFSTADLRVAAALLGRADRDTVRPPQVKPG